MQSYSVEKTIRENGQHSVVLVDEDLNIVEEVALFLYYLEGKGRALNTIESYCRDLKEYFTWLSKKELKFYEVNKRSMISFIDFIKSEEVGKKEEKSGRTINKYLATVASFYNYYEGVGGYIDSNPITVKDMPQSNKYFVHKVNKGSLNVNFFRQKEKKSKNIKRLFRNQIELLYEGIETLTEDKELAFRNKILFRLLYESGCRIGETLGLRLMDYSEPDPTDQIGTIYVRRHLPYYHKDHSLKTNERDIPVSMDLIFAIDDYVCSVRPQSDTIDTIFVNHSTSSEGKFMIRSTVESIFKELSEQVGIKCTPHMLRHTHGTELKESGYSEMYLMDRLGHSSIESTKKYMHISYEAQVKAYARFIEQRGGEFE
ncbi:tyrosine-type recombinase/integrase [Lentibacillus cibarius]|uniref:Tyrosine-type recombinase/integrase n=1 Tax=Lentibacillus cibarius TaxID=2583219 RepID=A0A549YGN5_9BACI|nr:tyrosine-type recombinase/integrase [Lentibacillus cibarius]TRM11041.1 tyrosine-type recombinase/integrase [Lentibacillus cibarius]